ncbi:MAG: sigma 54-interacting transcriptional regulator [bacterium]|nr:sigma 54-interacting transcriptional regulator [bacterium]
MSDQDGLKLDPMTTETIMDSISDGIFTVDNDFVITSFNQAAEQITGIPASRALGIKCSEVFNADICDSDCPQVKAVNEDRSLIRYPVSIACKGGNKAFIKVTASPMKDRSGKVIGGIVTFSDLSFIWELQKKVQGAPSFEGIIFHNSRMREIISILPRIAESDSTVLVQGESGTGKDLIAKAIHRLSPRKEGPMIVVNCGALPDTLLESELFGYEAGAFTDARKDKPGRFAQADMGSIFLDEIGDVSPALQTRLLRVIQERSFEPLGSTRTVRSNVRIIAATNKHLSEEVNAGRFRQDLYYRVNVFQISLPPLRERKEDILPIADSFIQRMNRITRKSLLGLSPGSIEMFMNHDWPGNIRELENIIEHAFILCPQGLILREHLPAVLSRSMGPPPVSFAGKTLAQIEAQAISEALARHGGNRSAAARELGVDKTTIWRKMRKLESRDPN